MVSQICKFVDTESKIEVTKSQGKRELLFNRYRVFVGMKKKALHIDSGDSYTTL